MEAQRTSREVRVTLNRSGTIRIIPQADLTIEVWVRNRDRNCDTGILNLFVNRNRAKFRFRTLIQDVHASTNISNTHFGQAHSQIFGAANGEGDEMQIRVNIPPTQSAITFVLQFDNQI